MFLSTLSFSLANVLVKGLTDIPAMEVVFFRCLIASIFLLYRAAENRGGLARDESGSAICSWIFRDYGSLPFFRHIAKKFLLQRQ